MDDVAKELVQSVQKGCIAEDKLVQLFEDEIKNLARKFVQQYCLRWTSGSALANAVFQSALRNIRSGRASFQGEAALRAYLRAILNKKAKKVAEHEHAEKRGARKSTAFAEGDVFPDGEPLPDLTVQTREIAAKAVAQIFKESGLVEIPDQPDSDGIDLEGFGHIIRAMSLHFELRPTDIHRALAEVFQGQKVPSPTSVRTICAETRTRFEEILFRKTG